MTIQFCDSFALELVEAIHDFTADTFKVALFQPSAALGVSTTAYATTNEVANGGGYTTGGATLSLAATYPKLSAHVCGVRFSDVSWTLTTLTSLRYALVYNASKSNRAVLSIDLGSQSALGLTTITFPASLDPLITIRNPILAA